MMENTPGQNETSKPIKSIRTFQSDVEDIVKSGEGSMARIAIAENERKVKQSILSEETVEPESNSGLKTKILISVIVLLILTGAGATAYVFLKPKEITKVPISQNEFSIISTENNKDLDVAGLSAKKIQETIANEREKANLRPNSFLALNLKNGKSESSSKLSVSEFLEKLQLRMPGEVARTLSNSYAIGVHNFNGNKAYIILKTEYFQNAFIGMLAWEKTMREDLGTMLIPPTTTHEVATTSDKMIKQPDVFEDVVIRNKDVRILKDDSGETLLLYSFPDKNTLVITTSKDTLNQIVSRLITVKQIQ